MKPQFQHQVVTSFSMWLDHIILKKGQAYQNIESTLYYQEDSRLDPGYIAFASPHKQWVTDSSIEGAKIIEGIILDGYYLKANQQEVIYDFENGRVLIPRQLANPSSNVEAVYSVKDFNIYITDQTEEELLIESKFDKNSRYAEDIFEGIKPYDQVVPAIFLSYEYGENIPFAFGGEDITQSNIRCVVFAENSYQLDGIFSLLKDTNTTSITNVGYNEFPLNEFGSLKYGKYDYQDLSERYYNVNNTQSLLHIDKVTVSKLNDRVAKKSHPGLYIGFVDFTIRAHRFPRQELTEPVASRPPALDYIPIAPYELTLITIQKPYAPYDFSIDTNLPYAPYGLFLTKTRHTRLQPGEVASISILQGGKLIIKLDGYAGQIAYLNIFGESIKIGSDANDNLIWDGHVFQSRNETINVTVAGAEFEVKWLGTGSQIIELTRSNVTSWNEFTVDVYIPCSSVETNESGLQTPVLERVEEETTSNRNPEWIWTKLKDAVYYEVDDVFGNIIQVEDHKYSSGQNLKDGEYSIQVRAVNSAGLKSEWSNELRYIIDSTSPKTPPVVTINSGPYDNYIDVSWDTDERDIKQYHVELIDEVLHDTQTFEIIKTTEKTFYKELREGRYTLNVYSEDSAGNLSKPFKYVFRIGMRFDLIRTQISSDPVLTFSVLPTSGMHKVRNEKGQTNNYAIAREELVIVRPSKNTVFLNQVMDTQQDIMLYTEGGKEILLQFIQFNTATPYYQTGKYGIFKMTEAIDKADEIKQLRVFMF